MAFDVKYINMDPKKDLAQLAEYQHLQEQMISFIFAAEALYPGLIIHIGLNIALIVEDWKLTFQTRDAARAAEAMTNFMNALIKLARESDSYQPNNG